MNDKMKNILEELEKSTKIIQKYETTLKFEIRGVFEKWAKLHKIEDPHNIDICIGEEDNIISVESIIYGIYELRFPYDISGQYTLIVSNVTGENIYDLVITNDDILNPEQFLEKQQLRIDKFLEKQRTIKENIKKEDSIDIGVLKRLIKKYPNETKEIYNDI